MSPTRAFCPPYCFRPGDAPVVALTMMMTMTMTMMLVMMILYCISLFYSGAITFACKRLLVLNVISVVDTLYRL